MKLMLLSNLAIALVCISPVILEAALPAIVLSQTSSRYSNADLVKARNLARQTIETKNGGIQQYRAEKSMHGPASQSPFTENEDGTLTFKFLGGTPAKPPTVESVVTVNPANNWKVTVDYNGKIRR